MIYIPFRFWLSFLFFFMFAVYPVLSGAVNKMELFQAWLEQHIRNDTFINISLASDLSERDGFDLTIDRDNLAIRFSTLALSNYIEESNNEGDLSHFCSELFRNVNDNVVDPRRYSTLEHCVQYFYDQIKEITDQQALRVFNIFDVFNFNLFKKRLYNSSTEQLSSTNREAPMSFEHFRSQMIHVLGRGNSNENLQPCNIFSSLALASLIFFIEADLDLNVAAQNNREFLSDNFFNPMSYRFDIYNIFFVLNKKNNDDLKRLLSQGRLTKALRKLKKNGRECKNCLLLAMISCMAQYSSSKYEVIKIRLESRTTRGMMDFEVDGKEMILLGTINHPVFGLIIIVKMIKDNKESYLAFVGYQVFFIDAESVFIYWLDLLKRITDEDILLKNQETDEGYCNCDGACNCKSE